MPTTLIRKADLIVAWDASEKSHTYLPDADMAFTDGVLRFVGRHYEGPARAGSGILNSWFKWIFCLTAA